MQNSLTQFLHDLAADNGQAYYNYGDMFCIGKTTHSREAIFGHEGTIEDPLNELNEKFLAPP